MNLRRQRTLCIEIYKTLNKLNPDYMNEIFKLYRQTRQKNLSKPGNSKPNQATFGTKRLRAYDIRSYGVPYPTI